MLNNDGEVVAMFKEKCEIDSKIFEAGKEYKMTKNNFKKLKSEHLTKLTPESFWANIKFIDYEKICDISRLYNVYMVGKEKKEKKVGYIWPKYNNSLETLVEYLVTKHVNEVSRYLMAKRSKSKNPLEIAKESLRLLYPEKKDYLNSLNEDDWPAEIKQNLLLGTEDPEQVESNKEYKSQITQIRKIKEEQLYTQLLKIDKKYIDYFSPNFLYRKVIQEKNNSGELNIFQEAIVEVWVDSVYGFDKRVNIIDRLLFEPSIAKGWELCKFVFEQKVNTYIKKFEDGDQANKTETREFFCGLYVLIDFLEKMPKDRKAQLVFSNKSKNGIDDTINRISVLLSDSKFLDFVNGNRIHDSIDTSNKKFYDSLYDIFVDEKKKVLSLNDDNKEYFLWLLSVRPTFINKCESSFILENLDNKIVWYAFCNFLYYPSKAENIFKHFINDSGEVLEEKKDTLLKIIEGKPNILSDLGGKNCEFTYPYITKLILNENKSILKALRHVGFYGSSDYGICKCLNSKDVFVGTNATFWKSYFNWLAQDSGENANKDDLNKIILTGFCSFSDDCFFYQEDYWSFDKSENGLIALADSLKAYTFEEYTFCKFDILGKKYVKDNNLIDSASSEALDIFDDLARFENSSSYSSILRGNNGGYRSYQKLVQNLEKFDPDYPGLSELKSYGFYLIPVHWLINIGCLISGFSLFFAAIWFISILFPLGFSLGALEIYLVIIEMFLASLYMFYNGFVNLFTQDYRLAEKWYLKKRLYEYDANLFRYKTVTRLFKKFVDSELCSVGDGVYDEIENYFKNNALDLEKDLKEYCNIDDFNKVRLDDVHKFFWKRGSNLMNYIDNLFDSALTKKIDETTIDKISNSFKQYVNQNKSDCANACEKFINKNIVNHLNEIKNMFNIRGKSAYFRHNHPDKNKELISYDISYDLSELLLNTLKELRKNDKNLQKENLIINNENKNINDEKPIVGSKEEEIVT